MTGILVERGNVETETHVHVENPIWRHNRTPPSTSQRERPRTDPSLKKPLEGTKPADNLSQTGSLQETRHFHSLNYSVFGLCYYSLNKWM